VPAPSNNLTKRDIITIASIVVLSLVAQILAALFLESTGSLLALGGSALVFLTWVLLRFRPRA
jgi:hypothetical protein